MRGNVFPPHSTDPFGTLGFLADAASGFSTTSLTSSKPMGRMYPVQRGLRHAIYRRGRGSKRAGRVRCAGNCVWAEELDVARERFDREFVQAESLRCDAFVRAFRLHGARVPHTTYRIGLGQIRVVVAHIICGDQRRLGVADVSDLALKADLVGACNFPPVVALRCRETHLGQCLTGFSSRCYIRCSAEVAQLVEQPIRNRQVPGSSPGLGSRIFAS